MSDQHDQSWTPQERESLKAGLKQLLVILIAVAITALIMALIGANVTG